MAKITIKGDTSGEVDIVVPAVAGSTTYNLSTSGGNVLSNNDIGTTVQGYDADTAKYDDATANFTGTLQQSGNAVATQAYVDSEVGSISVTPTQVSDQANTSTGYFDLPSGTTAQRPTGIGSGGVRYNTTTNTPEWYNGLTGVWQDFNDMSTSYTVEYLVVAGGGGAGLYGGGGGGAGGMRTGTVSVNKGTGYTVTIGAGGAESNNTTKYNGANSVFIVTATGGGAGGTGASAGAASGNSGGSGGGAHRAYSVGTGTAGQGNNGGQGKSSGAGTGGGGGGRGAVGANSVNDSSGGNGGNGITNDYRTGSNIYYAGGGGGGNNGSGTRGLGGLGGGGDGALGSSGASNGTANTGGGGGGGGNTTGTAGSGGSGIVVIRYASSSQIGSGGTVTSYTSGGTTYYSHTFTSSGTFTA